jgi:diadenosine tetraphosphate (Ap4A) HIT family hydrolase
MMIYDNTHLYVKVEDSTIPWLVIFTKDEYKELSNVPRDVRIAMYDMLDVIEKEMISYYNPKKINIASFGNYLPRVHMHIMARFEEDSHYPEPMWGKVQRESTLNLPDFDKFCKVVADKLNENFKDMAFV